MIFGTSRTVRVFAYARPVDLRKGYNGLYGLVKQELGQDPLNGGLFLFVNRSRNSCKILAWDGTGLCIFMKHLEGRRFAPLWRDDGGAVQLTPSELALYVEGCTIVGRQALSPTEVSPTSASARSAA